MTGDFEQQLASVATLKDPVRRALYLYVVRSNDAVSREQAAAGVGVQRTLAAFHLDKLAQEGLLEFEFRRLTGLTGPGAGRPAKLYRRGKRHIEVSLPPRGYDVAGRLLAEAIDASQRSGDSAHTELERAAFDFGRGLGIEAVARVAGRGKARHRGALVETLSDNGFEPRAVGREVVLSNCPFHELAQRHTELVCGMNLCLLRGLRSALNVDDDELVPRLEPQPGQCCVKFCSAA